MRGLLPAIACGLLSCDTKPAPALTCAESFFGRPVAQSGLTSAQCGPSCGCGAEAFQPPEWTEERLTRLQSWTLLDAPFDVSADPYASPVPERPAGVCGVVVVDAAARTYRLQTFSSESDAQAAGSRVTHGDACGACSTLADLAVYARNPDLGRVVQDCGVRTLTASLEANVECLTALGFTSSCARIWAFNTRNSRNRCLGSCLPLLDAAYHLADGGLNECLSCDERESGPVFKAVAGRTRRNTGIPSAICRPCAEVRRLSHQW
jgi:hypothetical protein